MGRYGANGTLEIAHSPQHAHPMTPSTPPNFTKIGTLGADRLKVAIALRGRCYGEVESDCAVEIVVARRVTPLVLSEFDGVRVRRSQ